MPDRILYFLRVALGKDRDGLEARLCGPPLNPRALIWGLGYWPAVSLAGSLFIMGMKKLKWLI